MTDLVEALTVTTNEIALIQSITVGQRDNPLWMDARQWQITASNFGRVCSQQREPGYYPPFLLKLIIGDYGQPASAALEWGSSHEDIAIQTYEQKTGQTVYPCGFFISDSHPFLGASPDGIVFKSLYGILYPYSYSSNCTCLHRLLSSKLCCPT